ncbi:hypothetical protein ABZ807_28260 [Micromonospora sp. NPDC047548]|uniref:hypothetical protein n=1 Tax=Micromonospora sp. NPDC047548 TaxID=3155624 RepID=UPI0033CC5809
MRYSILHRHGTSESLDDVPDAKITALLSELDRDVTDPEHGDVWLTQNSSGWSLGRFAGARRLVVLENTEPGGEALHRTGVTPEEAFRLFRRLANGDVDAIRGEAWNPGYGS